ncbi:MFS transporter [Streptosporangium sp. V21-05]|uniref:MFS transporter n=1 Tax=Streptosporangium sp. V21-05 TaxID=3446115 RepID=UPI003F52BF78
MPLPLYLLAVAVFAMGTSQFMLSGLVPDIAAGLDVPVGNAGLLTSAFAVGMILGAPLMAVLARRWPTRASLLGFVLVFACAHVAGALTASFPVLLSTRVVAALANAGFLAVALSTATTLVPAAQKGRALAVLLSGTTVATVAGVPGGAVLGTLLDWRATFWAIALLCLPAAFGIVRGIPDHVEGIMRDAPAGPPLHGPRSPSSRCPGWSWSCRWAPWSKRRHIRHVHLPGADRDRHRGPGRALGLGGAGALRRGVLRWRQSRGPALGSASRRRDRNR